MADHPAPAAPLHRLLPDAVRAADGTRLHLQAWLPPEGVAARGMLLVVHGLGEHGGRYDALARRLAADGHAVFAHDHRGHGRSEGRRGAIPSDDALLQDLAAVIDALPALGGAGPLRLLGHSLGGLVAARFVAEALAPAPAPWSRAVDALALSSPALDPGMSGAQRALLALLGPLAPGLAVGNGLDPLWVCRDAAVVRAYIDDPLVHDRVTPRLVRFIVDAGRQVLAAAPRWALPTWLHWAGADRCVAPRGSAAFAAAAPRGLVQAREWPGLYHEIFNEPERDGPIAALAAWLREH